MRFFIFILIILSGLPVLGGNMTDQRIYGKDSPVKMYLFTSLACPHCAQFHQNILPEIQKKYLNTEKGQLIVVDMLMNQANLMGTMLIRCAPENKIRKIETTLYQNQKDWAWDEKKARSYLAKIAFKNVISSNEFKSCLYNEELKKTIISEQDRMSHLYDVKHMPTLIVRKDEKTAMWEGSNKETIMTELSDFFK